MESCDFEGFFHTGCTKSCHFDNLLLLVEWRASHIVCCSPVTEAVQCYQSDNLDALSIETSNTGIAFPDSVQIDITQEILCSNVYQYFLKLLRMRNITSTYYKTFN